MEIEKKKKADKFFTNIPVNQARKLLQRINIIVLKKKCINKLFIKKFIHYSLLKLY